VANESNEKGTLAHWQINFAGARTGRPNKDIIHKKGIKRMAEGKNIEERIRIFLQKQIEPRF